MKIIELGPLVSEPWSMKGTCPKCLTKVEIEKDDVSRTWQEADRPYESAGYYYTWTCPVCRNTVWITDAPRNALLLKHPELRDRA